MYGPPKPTKNQWIEREKNEKGSSYSPPMQRGQQQITRAPDVKRAESLPLDGRIANARHLSDAARAQAYGEVPERSVEDIIVPSDNVQNKAKGDLPDAKDVRLEGFWKLANHGIISKEYALDYKKTDARVRAIEADASLSKTQKGTQLDAIRSDYLKRNDPRGFQDRMPVYNSTTGELDKFLRQDHKTNDMLNLSMEARKRNALIFDEVTSSGDPDVKNAKLGTSIPGVSGFKASKGTSGVRSSKELLRDIADHDLEMTEESWAGAAKLAKEEGYTPDPLSVKKATPVTKRTIKGLLSSRQAITPKSKGLAGDDALISTWEKDAVRISDIVNSHSVAMQESERLDSRFRESLTTYGSIDAVQKSSSQDKEFDIVRDNALDDESVSVKSKAVWNAKAGSGEKGNRTDAEALHKERQRAVAIDNFTSGKREKVLDFARADALANMAEFKTAHPSGTDRDFVRFMAKKSLESSSSATSPFSVEKMESDGKVSYNPGNDKGYEIVHNRIFDAIENNRPLNDIASEYAKMEINQLEDTDLHNAVALSKKADTAVSEAEFKIKTLDPKDPQRDIAVIDHSEAIRYADNKAKSLEIMKMNHERRTGKPWEGSGKAFDSKAPTEFSNKFSDEATKAEAEMAHYKSVYDDPSVGWKARKEAQAKMKSAQSRYEDMSGYATAKHEAHVSRASVDDVVAEALALAGSQASEKKVTVNKGLGGRFKR